MAQPNLLPEEHLKALGRITANFSNLDMILKLMLQILAGTKNPYEGHALTAEIQFEQLTRILPALWEIRFGPEPAKEFKEAINKAKSAQEKRNSVIHSTWVLTANPDIVHQIEMRAKTAKGRFLQMKTPSMEDLNKIAEEILQASIVMTPFLTRAVESEKKSH